MPWGPPVLGAQLTSTRVGVFSGPLPLVGVRIVALTSPTVDQVLTSPFLLGVVEINSNNKYAGKGTSPDFPIGPKWRKVVRQIG